MSSLAEKFGSSKEVEAACRRKLAIMTRMCAMQDMVGLFGHISLRVPKTPLILLTPGCGADKMLVRSEDIFVMHENGDMLFHPGGDFPLPFAEEWRIHTQIHRDRPEMDCVAHLHAKDSTLLGICQQSFVAVGTQGFELGGKVAVWDNPALVLDDELAVQLSNTLGKHNLAVIMRGHGSVVVGESAERCFMRCYGMEENARLQIAAHSLGGHVPFKQEVIDLTIQHRRQLNVLNDIWKYFERKALMASPLV